MRWRTGRRVKWNVYEGDRPICQCHNEEDAARIVAAMNLTERAIEGFSVPEPPPLGNWAADHAAPIQANEALHGFTPVVGNPFCGRCGAGRLHEIHKEH